MRKLLLSLILLVIVKRRERSSARSHQSNRSTQGEESEFEGEKTMIAIEEWKLQCKTVNKMVYRHLRWMMMI